jgi:hypothetical protein
MTQCRCSNPDYLVITRPLLADFEELAAQRAVEEIRHYINKLAIEYQRQDSFNPRRFMMDLSDSIKNGEHLG